MTEPTNPAHQRAARARLALGQATAERDRIKQGLPHLYGHKWYAWAKAFFDSQNQMNLLCAANQISKSSTQIRKMIHWATYRKLWPTLWPGRNGIPHTPRQFWLLYPSKEVATAEWHTKIEPEFMPRNEFKTHPVYGWREVFDKKQIHSIHFNSGVTIYVKSYSQDVHTLQSGTCFVAGTLILTPRGARPIEELRVGDEVIGGASGRVESVLSTMARDWVVITRRFSDGTEITGTGDHPFFTENRGWVPFRYLQPEDICSRVTRWNLIKKLSCLVASYSRGTRRIRTSGSAIISATASTARCILFFGRRTISAAYRRTMSFITITATPSTTDLRISSFLRGQSTLGCTRKKSGSCEATAKSTAASVGSSSSQEAPSARSRSFVHGLAGSLWKIVVARNAELLSRFARISQPVFVLDCAPIAASPTSAKVYNLTISGSHTYFANGILTHNCDAIFADEELPEDLLPELQARLYASEGHFHMVFTATRNQLMWLRAIEGRGDEELFEEAFKQQITMFDCQHYIDGTPGHFDKQKIAKIIASCKNKTEVLRRVYGKFVRESGRVYSEFSALTHFIKERHISPDWQIYSAIDNGSGGGEGHPAAFVFIAVRPDKRLGYVYKGWRGDDMLTTAGDVLEKWDLDRQGDKPVQTVYDWAAKDLATIGDRMGIGLSKAEKSHEIGEDIVNVLFKNNMLFVFDTPELRKVGTEFMSVMKETPKRRRKDDLSDAIRYACCSVPWDWSAIQGKPTEEESEKSKKERPWTAEDQAKADNDARRGIKEASRETEEGWEPLTGEFDFWNDAYGNG